MRLIAIIFALCGCLFAQVPNTVVPSTIAPMVCNGSTCSTGATVTPVPKVKDSASPVSITVTSFHACDVAGGCTYNLPAITAANLDLQVCVWNKAGRVGAITFQLPAATQMDVDGALGTAAATLASAGALGDMACVVAQETGIYKATTSKGTWTNN